MDSSDALPIVDVWLYPRIVANALAEVLDDFRPDIVLYDAGVDPHEEDPLGRLSLTDSGLLRRDLLVSCLFGSGFGHCLLWVNVKWNACAGDRLLPCEGYSCCRMHRRWLWQWCAETCFASLHSRKSSHTDVERLQPVMPLYCRCTWFVPNLCTLVPSQISWKWLNYSM